MSFLDFVLERRWEILARAGEHVGLVAVSILAAVAIGVPAGMLAARRERLARPLLAAAGIVQTIPSLALFGILIPLPFLGGIGARTAIIALVVYALLPVLQGTATGLRGVPASIREAGAGMGMTPRQLLFWVEVPLALPVMMAGIRVAAVSCVGIATIAAAIGAGGLGTFIFRGVAMVDNRQILMGAVPAAAMALAADLILGVVERRLSPARRASRGPGIAALWIAGAALVAAGALFAWTLLPSRLPSPGEAGATTGREGAIVVGSKNFTEQVILGEILAILIERRAGLRVERRFDLAGTFVCHKALVAGEIDLYVEYTGTALTAILEAEPVQDPATAWRTVAREYARRFDLTWLPPLGFNNTFAIVVRADDAERHGLARISDLARVAGRFQAGFGPEFLERADGYRGLAAAYGLHLIRRPREMDLGLLYRALADRHVDVVAGSATDGLIEALGLVVLEDDRRYFPPYDAAPVARAATLRRHPEVDTILRSLAGRITEARMRRMNLAADGERRSPGQVAVEFIERDLADQP